ncbi:MAG: amidoligase family protein [Tranquillimonas sp.]
MQHPEPSFARPQSLPRPTDATGTARRVGIEVECGGLTERELADRAASVLGGTVEPDGPYAFRVKNTRIGDLKVMLDTAFREKADSHLARLGLDWGRAVIPAELVTDPILPEDIAQVDELCRNLRAAGATGTRDGLLLGFGTHLNIAVAGLDGPSILPTVRAFALLEGWLRQRDPIDPARRLLPFVDPYPTALTDRLAADDAAGLSLGRLMDIYLDLAPSRNHALDLLPLFRHADSERVTSALAHAEQVSPRPAYHYRLPDSRLDEADWSIAYEWNRWCLVERVAADAPLLEALAAAWRSHRRQILHLGRGWPETADGILRQAAEARA